MRQSHYVCVVSATLSVVVCVQAQPVGGGLFGGASIDAGGRQGSMRSSPVSGGLFPAASMGMAPDLGLNLLPGAAQVRYG